MRANHKVLLLSVVMLASAAAEAQVVRGYTGTRSFVNCGNEDPTLPFCVDGAGSSVFLSFVPEAQGVLYLNTDGSNFDTVMAVFVRSVSNPNVFQRVACNDNGGIDGKDSAVSLAVRGGETNFVVLAGMNGECGTLSFNFSLVTRSTLSVLAPTPAGEFRGRVSGHTNMKFTIQASTNLTSWTSLLTTNSSNNTALDFVDRTQPKPPRRFYRALMLP